MINKCIIFLNSRCRVYEASWFSSCPSRKDLSWTRAPGRTTHTDHSWTWTYQVTYISYWIFQWWCQRHFIIIFMHEISLLTCCKEINSDIEVVSDYITNQYAHRKLKWLGNKNVLKEDMYKHIDIVVKGICKQVLHCNFLCPFGIMNIS